MGARALKIFQDTEHQKEVNAVNVVILGLYAIN